MEYKTITVPGDTTGTWLTTNGIGMRVMFNLGSGSTRSMNATGAWQTGDGNQYSVNGTTQLSATSGATMYITGVQLEKGSTATVFDYRDYGRELILCQRYFYQMAKGINVPLGISATTSSSDMRGCIWFPVTMRTAPSMTSVSGSGYYRFYNGNFNASFSTIGADLPSTSSWAFGSVTGLSGVSAGQAGIVLTNDSNSSLSFSSEL